MINNEKASEPRRCAFQVRGLSAFRQGTIVCAKKYTYDGVHYYTNKAIYSHAIERNMLKYLSVLFFLTETRVRHDVH